MSELIVGTECGGSDPTSGLAANPVIGAMSDLVAWQAAPHSLRDHGVHWRRALSWPAAPRQGGPRPHL